MISYLVSHTPLLIGASIGFLAGVTVGYTCVYDRTIHRYKKVLRGLNKVIKSLTTTVERFDKLVDKHSELENLTSNTFKHVEEIDNDSKCLPSNRLEEELRQAFRDATGLNVPQQPKNIYDSQVTHHLPIQKQSKYQYVTISEQQPRSISRGDELDILHRFQHLKGMRYHQAVQDVKEKGYSLHPIYINNNTPDKLLKFDSSIIGVRVRDNDHCGIGKPSSSAIVVDVIDIGGQDLENRGVVTI